MIKKLLRKKSKGVILDITGMLITIGVTFSLLIILQAVLFNTHIQAIGAIREKITYMYPDDSLRPIFYTTYANSRFGGSVSLGELTAAATYFSAVDGEICESGCPGGCPTIDGKVPFYVPYKVRGRKIRINLSDPILTGKIQEAKSITDSSNCNFTISKGNILLHLANPLIGASGNLKIPELVETESRSSGMINATFKIPA